MGCQHSLLQQLPLQPLPLHLHILHHVNALKLKKSFTSIRLQPNFNLGLILRTKNFRNSDPIFDFLGKFDVGTFDRNWMTEILKTGWPKYAHRCKIQIRTRLVRTYLNCQIRPGLVGLIWIYFFGQVLLLMFFYWFLLLIDCLFVRHCKFFSIMF